MLKLWVQADDFLSPNKPAPPSLSSQSLTVMFVNKPSADILQATVTLEEELVHKTKKLLGS